LLIKAKKGDWVALPLSHFNSHLTTTVKWSPKIQFSKVQLKKI
jgi:hypothetical protein